MSFQYDPLATPKIWLSAIATAAKVSAVVPMMTGLASVFWRKFVLA